jgi:hypothetical protein
MKKAPTINGVPMACCSQICDDEFMEVNFGKPRSNTNYANELVTTVEDYGRSDEFQVDLPPTGKAIVCVNGRPITSPIVPGNSRISIIQIEY